MHEHDKRTQEKALENEYTLGMCIYTGISSEMRTKLCDWAVWQDRAGCYSLAALSLNDSKTLYAIMIAVHSSTHP